MKQYNYIEMELLKCLCKLHLITYDQIFKLFAEFNHDEIADTLNSLLVRSLLSSREIKIKDSKKQLINVKVFYLNAKSRVYIKKTFPLVARYLRERCFSAINRQRIYHDLLIVQSLIYLKKKNDIVEFWSEEELKARRQNPADLRVTIEEQGCLIDLDIEIVVTNKPGQIKRKSSEMLFFTPLQNKADAIEAIHNVPAIMIDLESRNQIKPLDYMEVDGEDSYLIDKLKDTGGALTAPALALILTLDRAATHSKLVKLERSNYITAARVHAHPGVSTGTPNKLYAASEYDIATLSDKLFALLISKTIVDEFENGWFFLSANRFERTLTFINADRVTKKIYLDDGKKPLKDEISRYFNLPVTTNMKQIKFADIHRYQIYQQFKEASQKAVA